MDQPTYDIYITGKFVEGVEPASAKANFARLFKTTPEAAEKYFSGRPQVLKRGIEKAEALKYKAALHKAGVMVAFKAHQAETDVSQQGQQTTVSANPVTQAQPSTATQAETNTAKNEEDWSLAPAGSDVLKPNERREVAAADIDTSAIKLVSAFAEPEAPVKDTPPAPDTSHISVAAVGEDLLTDKPEAPPPLPLDLDSITLAPPGTELEELHEDLPPLDPDISGISMAEPGADLLEGQSKEAPPPPPDTDHLKVLPE